MTSKENAEQQNTAIGLPKHIAIIMDGNGRWAKQKKLPRVAGHRAGVKALKKTVQLCAQGKINSLTVYAFSSENWRRPKQEVSLLMDLFMTSLNQEIKALNDNDIRIRFIGEKDAFPEKLQQCIFEAEQLTANNQSLNFNIAANYGGRWDICNASRRLAEKVKLGELEPDDITEDLLNQSIQLSDLAEPDLFIRTGGERRISNYLLWQLAYTELYFSDCLWPDFDSKELEKAIAWYQGRERRYGQTSEQIKAVRDA